MKGRIGVGLKWEESGRNKRPLIAINGSLEEKGKNVTVTLKGGKRLTVPSHLAKEMIRGMRWVN